MFEPKWMRRQRESVVSRRFLKLEGRSGLVPPDSINEETKIEYYVDARTRQRDCKLITEYEAKGSSDDNGTKIPLLIVLISQIVAIPFLVGLEENLFNLNKIAVIPIFVLFVFVLLVINVWVFLRMEHTFHTRDHEWIDALGGIFDLTIAQKMQSIASLMKVFKGFVKWRRFMKIVYVQFSFVIHVMLGVWLGFGLSMLGWIDIQYLDNLSTLEYGIQFVWIIGLAIWLHFFEHYRVLHTSWRDPTLQLCVMANLLDRNNVPPVNVGSQGPSI